MNVKATIEGIRDAWSEWLYAHPVSVPDIVRGAISDAFGTWLDKNSDEIIERISEKLSKNPIVIKNLKTED